MTLPLVSVLMPVRDTREDWLWTAIHGIATQDYPNLHLCIGDQSTRASTVDASSEAEETWPDRIRVARMGPDKPGTAYALDAAMAISDPSTVYYSKADSDDIFACSREGRRVRALESLPPQVAIAYENFLQMNYEPRPWIQPIVLKPYNMRAELAGSLIPGNSMWRASVYEKIPKSFAFDGYEGRSNRHAEDYNLWLAITDFWDGFWIDCDPAASWTYRNYGGSKYRKDRKGVDYARSFLSIRACERRGMTEGGFYKAGKIVA